jgi:hypothetical protein
MMSLKKIFGVFGIIIVAGALYYAWYVHVNYRFETISENKVYKSALIKPDRLEDFLIEPSEQSQSHGSVLKVERF